MNAEKLMHIYEQITRLPEWRYPKQTASYRNVMLRTRRATSWIAYAKEQMDKELYHTAFCFYWIAFNACYGSGPQTSERDEYVSYLRKIEKHDEQKIICHCILNEILGDVEDLVGCRFAYNPFWREGHRSQYEEGWRESFRSEFACFQGEMKKSVNMATVTVLSILFDRIYCVRNQVMHGSTTREKSTGEDQIKYSAIILDRLIPVFVHLMLRNRHVGAWSRPYYPGEKLVRGSDGSYVLESGHPWRS